MHDPCAEPAHEYPEAQSVLALQLTEEHVPAFAELQAAPKPQSFAVPQAVVFELTRASADTWKSEYTTRPHCLSCVAAVGVLNVIDSSMSDVPPVALLDDPYTQRWLGGFLALRASWRGSLIVRAP